MELNAVLILGAIASGYMAHRGQRCCQRHGHIRWLAFAAIRQALIIAAVASLMGAVLVGGTSPRDTSGPSPSCVTLEPMELACGMLANLFAAAI